MPLRTFTDLRAAEVAHGDRPASPSSPSRRTVILVILGVRRTRELRRKRTAAEQVGRAELLRRLAVALSSVEATARAQRATTIREAFDESRAPPARRRQPLASRAVGAPKHEGRVSAQPTLPE